MNQEMTEMANHPQFSFPSGTCTGTCTWVNQGGQWFATNDTCSAGCSCPTHFRAPGGTIVNVVPKSTNPNDGLPDPLFQIFRTRYPDAIVQTISNTEVLVRCVTAGAVIDLS
jgi:hypothetical protein